MLLRAGRVCVFLVLIVCLYEAVHRGTVQAAEKSTGKNDEGKVITPLRTRVCNCARLRARSHLWSS